MCACVCVDGGDLCKNQHFIIHFIRMVRDIFNLWNIFSSIRCFNFFILSVFICLLFNSRKKKLSVLFDAFFSSLFFLTLFVCCICVCLFKRIIMYVCFTHFTSTLFTIYIIKNTHTHTLHTTSHQTA